MTGTDVLVWGRDKGMKIPVALACLNGAVMAGLVILLLFTGSFNGDFALREQDTDFQVFLKVSFSHSKFGLISILFFMIYAKLVFFSAFADRRSLNFFQRRITPDGTNNWGRWFMGIVLICIGAIFSFTSAEMFVGSLMHPFGFHPLEAFMIP
jgi:hypothetical protein